MRITEASKFTYAMSSIDNTFSMCNLPVIETTLVAAIREVLTAESQINVGEGLTKVSHITIQIRPR